MERLSTLVSNETYGTRLRAGLVIELLVSPGVTLKRRVEDIELVASNVNKRTAALDIDLTAPLALARQLDVDVDCAVLSLAPKALMSGFQIRTGEGAVQSSAKRDTDSRMAQCFLVALAMSRESGLPGLGMPSQAIWTLIYEHCFRFPIEFDPYEPLAHALSLGQDLANDSDYHWWAAACMSHAWRTWLLRLGDLFMIVTDVKAVEGLQRFEYTRRSARDPIKNPGVAEKQLGPAHPHMPLAFRLYDLGHAESEHVHLHAPEGTFLSGGFLAQRHEPTAIELTRRRRPRRKIETLTYRRRPSRHEIIIYIERSRPGNSLLLANLWPQTRGFVTPLKYISYWVIALSLAAGATTSFSLVDDLRQAADATFMLMYLLPTLALAYLMQPEGQPEIRWRMLAWSRRYAMMLMGISIGLSTLWLIKPEGPLKWVVLVADVSGAALAALVARRGNKVVSRILRANEAGKTDEENGPTRGHRVTLQIFT